MTKAEQTRLTAWRLKILRVAGEEPRLVARTCQYFGISRTAFHKWKRRFDELEEEGLADRAYHRPHGALDGQTPFERLIAKTRAGVSPES